MSIAHAVDAWKGHFCTMAQIATRDGVSRQAVGRVVRRLLRDGVLRDVERDDRGWIVGVNVAEYDQAGGRSPMPVSEPDSPSSTIWTMPQIAARDGVSAQAVQKAVARLVKAGAITDVRKDKRGRIVGVNVAEFDGARFAATNTSQRHCIETWVGVAECARLKCVDKSLISRRVARLERQGALTTRSGPNGAKLFSRLAFERAFAVMSLRPQDRAILSIKEIAARDGMCRQAVSKSIRSLFARGLLDDVRRDHRGRVGVNIAEYDWARGAELVRTMVCEFCGCDVRKEARYQKYCRGCAKAATAEKRLLYKLANPDKIRANSRRQLERAPGRARRAYRIMRIKLKIAEELGIFDGIDISAEE